MFLARSAHALIYDWCLYDGSFDLPLEGKKYFDTLVGLLIAK
jgi:hypothetical protein